MKLTKAAYKPLSMTIGMGGGVLAGAVFKRAWRLVDSNHDAPSPTDEDRSWKEVMVASALEGMIFSLVRAAVDRAGAAGVRRLTGTWPA